MKKTIVILICSLLIFQFLTLSVESQQNLANNPYNKTQLTISNNTTKYNPCFSSDGSKIIYQLVFYEPYQGSEYTVHGSVWTMNSNGSNNTKLDYNIWATGFARYCLNDTHIAFVTQGSNVVGGGSNITIVNITTGEYRNVTREGLYSFGSFTVSPDGSKAVVNGYACDSVYYPLLYVDLINGTIEKELFYGNYDIFSLPTFTPDGLEVGFGRGNKLSYINIFTNETRELSNLSIERGSGITISPEGNEIIYSISNQTKGISEIWAMSTDGKNLTFVTNGTNPCYSPDGSKIVYSSDEDGDGKYDIWIMDRPPLDIDEKTTNGEVSGFEYYLFITIIIIVVAITVLYNLLRKRKSIPPPE